MLKQLENTDLSQMLESCPIGLALSNDKKVVTWVNNTFESHLGISKNDISGKNIKELPDILKPLFGSAGAVHIPANPIRDEQWFMCNQHKLDNNGTTIHYITDVGPLQLLMQEREQLKSELREALAVDEVTGMPNKVALYQSLEPQISRSRRYNNLLSIVILRMNQLKQLDEKQKINLLIPISQLLHDQVRWADIVGKLNDSDFLLVLPETAADACKNLSDNLSEHINALPIPDGFPENFKISVSFGYAEWAKGDDLTLFMKKAQKMLQDK